MPHHQRPLLVTGIGGAIAAVGVVLFLSAHALATPDFYTPADHQLHEPLRAAFAIAVWFGGVIIAAVGLAAWCRNGPPPAAGADRAGG